MLVMRVVVVTYRERCETTGKTRVRYACYGDNGIGITSDDRTRNARYVAVDLKTCDVPDRRVRCANVVKTKTNAPFRSKTITDNMLANMPFCTLSACAVEQRKHAVYRAVLKRSRANESDPDEVGKHRTTTVS